MYTTSDFKRGLRIEIEGQPYSIMEFEHHKPGKGASIVRTKLRNLVTGQVISPTFRSGDKVGTPDVEDKDGQFLFAAGETRSEEHTSELQSRLHLVCRLLLEKKKTKHN